MAQCIYDDWHNDCSLQYEDAKYDDDGNETKAEVKVPCDFQDDPYPGDGCENFEDATRLCDRCGGNSTGDCDNCEPLCVDCAEPESECVCEYCDDCGELDYNCDCDEEYEEEDDDDED